MSYPQLNCAFLGLTITSTWGNGHATTYRGLLKELSKRGHRVTFLERDAPWYASNREFEKLPYCDVALYCSLDELIERFAQLIHEADIVMVGSYVPEGIAVGHWITSAAQNGTAFYDIDTPVTLSNLKKGKCEYLSRDLIRKYELYLSFTGGPTLDFIEQKLGSSCARPLYCSVDPALYYPEPISQQWSAAYLGTYAADRQPALERLLLDVARQEKKHKFAVAGPQYPAEIEWPPNIQRIEHLPASEHRRFYNSQAFTLNVTRQDMVRAGFSPSVRLFEAAACGVPILTDEWPGLDTFFQPCSEILPVRSSADVTSYLQMPVQQRLEIAENARWRTLQFHTAAVRAEQFEGYAQACLGRIARSRRRGRIVVSQPATAALI